MQGSVVLLNQRSDAGDCGVAYRLAQRVRWLQQALVAAAGFC